TFTESATRIIASRSVVYRRWQEDTENPDASLERGRPKDETILRLFHFLKPNKARGRRTSGSGLP
ncbi:hypothetical protein AVEN_119139-1, partial [Araneus ventricosus]